MATTATPQIEHAIAEKDETPLPPFLRVAYLVIASPCLAYLILFLYGEVANAKASPLVQPLIGAIAVVVALFFFGSSIFAAQKGHQ